MIAYYSGTNGPTVESIDTEQELCEVIDAIHTKVMDGPGEDHLALRILEEAMTKLLEMYPEIMPV